MGFREPRIEYLRHWPISVPNGRQIYDAGEVPEAFYRVDCGCVRLQVLTPDGRRQILGFCLPGDVFGLDFCDVRPMGAEAATVSKLSRFPILQALRGGDKDDCSGLLAASSQVAANLTGGLIGVGQVSAAERVIWFLNWIAERQGLRAGGQRVVHLPMSRRDIADYLGLAPETLSRILKQLVGKGRIEKRGRTILLGAPCAQGSTAVGRLVKWKVPELAI